MVNIILSFINEIYQSIALQLLIFFFYSFGTLYLIALILNEKIKSKFNIIGRILRFLLRFILSKKYFDKFTYIHHTNIQTYKRWIFLQKQIHCIIVGQAFCNLIIQRNRSLSQRTHLVNSFQTETKLNKELTKNQQPQNFNFISQNQLKFINHSQQNDFIQDLKSQQSTSSNKIKRKRNQKEINQYDFHSKQNKKTQKQKDLSPNPLIIDSNIRQITFSNINNQIQEDIIFSQQNDITN
ncbi:transmembrane protein, putative (macronuclear) [Tetrahymena thermophila SB210]|uniref:Transmembrane protein, putative n=1 Tax=Tetrahymena thermophila (strain SB210) TaxID=312017 RepID=W7X8Y7_TETTS|nr:transmembrane protein, putative [Tetrahymena thermophila SB210]EWS73802.1 transmembrane protein, putative [Tetrahymena thermophila SB210]|eukprot:XP_012653682.1 transmembrane protein, putative [Tetrahymena thermophila SB210]